MLIKCRCCLSIQHCSEGALYPGELTERFLDCNSIVAATFLKSQLAIVGDATCYIKTLIPASKRINIFPSDSILSHR